MTVKELIKIAENALRDADVESWKAEALRISEDALGSSRTEILVNPHREVSAAQTERAKALLDRRAAGEPLQYILGRAAFMHLDIKVGPGVLIPRPETEGLCELAARSVQSAAPPRGEGRHNLRILDLCTGSGCIAAWAADVFANAEIYASDISDEALKIAASNLPSGVRLLKGDLFGALAPDCGPFDLILSNPPYIPSKTVDGLRPEVRLHEPRTALDGGRDGMDIVKRIIREAPKHMHPGGLLLVEIDETEETAASDACRVCGGYDLYRVLKDLAGRPRYLEAFVNRQSAQGASA